MTDKQILALSAQCGTINDFKTFFTDDELLEFASLLREKFIAELGEPVGYWSQGTDLDESDYYPAKDFPDLDTTDCIPLYALKDERK